MGERQLWAVASAQLGLVTTAQARAHLGRRQVERRLAEERLVSVRRSVYRLAGVPPTPWQELFAACLAAGPAAVASHRAAAALWALPGVISDAPELTVPWPLWVRLPGVRGHQTRDLPPSHVTVRHGVPVTSAARTIVDLGSVVGAELLGRIVDDALRRRLTTLAELRAVFETFRKGRRGAAAMRAVLHERQPGYHPGDSPREVDVLRAIVGAGLPRPVQQHQVVLGGRVYLLDLAYPELRIGIEYDGAVHAGVAARAHDRVRSNALALAGWTMLHFDRRSGPDEIAETVRAARANAPSGEETRGVGAGVVAR